MPRQTQEANDKHRADMATRTREKTRASQALDELRPPLDSARKLSCRLDLLAFIQTYDAGTCTLEFGEPHLELISKLQESILTGGLYAIAMQRGGGKTALSLWAAIWAICYGHVPWIVLIGATQTLTEKQLMRGIKAILRTNDMLDDDFPEITMGVRALEGEGRRCNGQRTAEGEPTLIEWGADRIVTPRMGGLKTDEIVVSAHGITGAFLGLQYIRGDGSTIRPGFVIIDDPQTDDSAKSAGQTRNRLETINTTVLGLAGPTISLAAVVACTKKNQNCLTSQLLDREKSPKWRGQRYKMIDPMPDNMALWSQYAEIRAERYRSDGTRDVEDGFLRDHWDEMHAGAVCSWPARVTSGDLSPLQTAMNYWADNPEMFASEMQNEPLSDELESGAITPKGILRQLEGYQRGTAPVEADACVCAIDCHDDLLYWSTLWYERETFSCGLSDYGTWPSQSLRNFTRGRVPTTMVTEAAKEGIAGPEGILRYALMNALPMLLNSRVMRNDGVMMTPERVVGDARWRKKTVYTAISSLNNDKLFAMFGQGIGAKQRPLNNMAQKRKRGVLRGDHWRSQVIRGEPRHVVVDTNHWISHLSARVKTPLGADGCFSIYQGSQMHHRLMIDHLTSMYPKTVCTEERSIEEWELKPTITENHWLDTIVYNLAAASYGGAHLSGEAAQVKTVRAASNQGPPPSTGGSPQGGSQSRGFGRIR